MPEILDQSFAKSMENLSISSSSDSQEARGRCSRYSRKILRRRSSWASSTLGEMSTFSGRVRETSSLLGFLLIHRQIPTSWLVPSGCRTTSPSIVSRSSRSGSIRSSSGSRAADTSDRSVSQILDSPRPSGDARSEEIYYNDRGYLFCKGFCRRGFA